MVSESLTETMGQQHGLWTGFASDHEEPARQVLTERVTGQRKVDYVLVRCDGVSKQGSVDCDNYIHSKSPDARTAGTSKGTSSGLDLALVSVSRDNRHRAISAN